MKALREFGIVLLSIALVAMITTLGVFISFRNIVNVSLGGEVVKSMITEGTSDLSAEEKEKINESVDKFVSYEGTQDVIDSFLNDINNSPDGSINVSDKTIDKLIKVVEDNRQVLIDFGATEKEIDDFVKEAKDPTNRAKIQESINEGYKELDVDMGNESQSFNLIKTYSSVASPAAIQKIEIAIGVVVALIILLSWSLYKWIRPVSISSIIAGLNLKAFYFAIDTILNTVSEDTTFTVDTTALKSISTTVLIGGIVGLIVYIIVNIIVKNTKKEKPVEVNNTVVNTTTTEVPTENNVQYDKFCSSCGAGVTKDTTVCPSCGAPLD